MRATSRNLAHLLVSDHLHVHDLAVLTERAPQVLVRGVVRELRHEERAEWVARGVQVLRGLEARDGLRRRPLRSSGLGLARQDLALAAIRRFRRGRWAVRRIVRRRKLLDVFGNAAERELRFRAPWRREVIERWPGSEELHEFGREALRSSRRVHHASHRRPPHRRTAPATHHRAAEASSSTHWWHTPTHRRHTRRRHTPTHWCHPHPHRRRRAAAGIHGCCCPWWPPWSAGSREHLPPPEMERLEAREQKRVESCLATTDGEVCRVGENGGGWR